jgi:peroxiredoxin (alkyl hydroperoxide reductase subunit C)
MAEDQINIHPEVCPRGLKLGEVVPDFEAVTTLGPLKLYNLRDNWVIIFSYLADFTPVAATEFIRLAEVYGEFESRSCRLIALSTDSLSSHIAWVRDVEAISKTHVPFSVIADSDLSIAREWGMVHPASRGEVSAVNSTWFIDPQAILRAVMYYPPSVGRSIPEILRVLEALQTADVDSVDTPADWLPGEKTLVMTPRTQESAERRLEEDYDCASWYLCRPK